jgi:hypothetical protein
VGLQILCRQEKQVVHESGWLYVGGDSFVVRDWSGRHNEGCLLSLVDCTCAVRGRSLPSLLRLLSAYQGDRVRSGTARLSFTHGGRNKTPRDFLVLPTGTCASMLAGECPIRGALALRLRTPGRRPVIWLEMPCPVPACPRARECSLHV